MTRHVDGVPGASSAGSGNPGQETTNLAQEVVNLIAIDVVGRVRNIGDVKGRTAAFGHVTRFGGHEGASVGITCHQQDWAADLA